MTFTIKELLDYIKEKDFKDDDFVAIYDTNIDDDLPLVEVEALGCMMAEKDPLNKRTLLFKGDAERPPKGERHDH